MKVTSWNVNGLRAVAKKGFLTWLRACDSDVVALQETRALPEQLSDEVREPEGWQLALHPAERKGYSGVGLLTRRAPDSVETTMGEE
ncbi:MAG: endonuclease/exonuclease/phosphatase family protein, partial [Myxococcota bacterium]|nr:endonuclease/exonuclease/phosphatase family protein [Myxococcota bacterium]